MRYPGRVTRTDYKRAAEIVEDLRTSLPAERKRRGLTVIQAAAAIGVSTSTVTRVTAGKSCRLRCLVLILKWMASGQN